MTKTRSMKVPCSLDNKAQSHKDTIKLFGKINGFARSMIYYADTEYDNFRVALREALKLKFNERGRLETLCLRFEVEGYLAKDKNFMCAITITKETVDEDIRIIKSQIRKAKMFRGYYDAVLSPRKQLCQFDTGELRQLCEFSAFCDEYPKPNLSPHTDKITMTPRKTITERYLRHFINDYVYTHMTSGKSVIIDTR